MKKLIPYKGYVFELNSYKLEAGEWVPRAWVIRDGDKLTMRPVWSKTSPTLEEADAIAIQLGRLWAHKNS